MLELSHNLGEFCIYWTLEPVSIRVEWQNQIVFSCGDEETPFLFYGDGEATFHESRGFFQLKEKETHWRSCTQAHKSEQMDSKWHLIGGSEEEQWTICLFVIDEQRLGLRISSAFGNRLMLQMKAHSQERVFGFGEQLTHLNMKGRCVPVLSQEPGIGRGVQPLTWLMNTAFKAGGEWHNSNAPAAWFMSSERYGFGLDNTEYSVFDFTSPDFSLCTVHSSELSGVIVAGATPASILEAYTAGCGRMSALPDWIHQGAIIGMQGGTETVRKMYETLERNKASVAAFWLQDWVGARKTSIGQQLWWNWELDEDRYSGWDSLKADLEKDGISLMSYINPFLVDAKEKGNVRRNLYQEAKEKGYFVHTNQGKEYAILNTSFSAALVDLSNPEAFNWLKSIIKEQLISTGVRGWMADFGEALPFDVKLHSKEDPSAWHNRYPMEWAKLNREAIQESGREGDIVFFNRAGFTHSPAYSTLFWMGDQLTHWSKEDGIYSALVGLLSSGLSGMTLNHGDIGGYTATTLPRFPIQIPGLSFLRSKELLLRWIEFYAFTAIFRTHEGNQPTGHVQIDHDNETLAHFAYFSRVFSALAPYRKSVFLEAEERGLPVVRHLWLVFPDDPRTLDIDDQFCLGEEFLIAPVLHPNATERRAYLPEGDWVHLWTGLSHSSSGDWIDIEAPISRPPVWFKAGSAMGKALLESFGD